MAVNFYTFLVDRQWRPFDNWCSYLQTFGGGICTRERKCNNPPPSNGGLDCVGRAVHQHSCNADVCTSDKKWLFN